MIRPYLALTWLASISLAQAVTFNVAGDWLADESGLKGIANGSLVVLIASTQNKTFESPNGAGGVASDSDDRVLGYFVANDFAGRINQGSFSGSIRVAYGDKAQGLENFGPGDPLIIRWFPTLTAYDVKQTPTANIPYGEFRSEIRTKGSDVAWIAPADGGATVSMTVLSSAVGTIKDPQGSVDVASLSAKRLENSIREVTTQLAVTIAGSGALRLSWPVAARYQQVQESQDLRNWRNIPMTATTTELSGKAELTIPMGQGAKFYRLSTEK